jgi:hypothetical protein
VRAKAAVRVVSQNVLKGGGQSALPTQMATAQALRTPHLRLAKRARQLVCALELCRLARLWAASRTRRKKGIGAGFSGIVADHAIHKIWRFGLEAPQNTLIISTRKN